MRTCMVYHWSLPLLPSLLYTSQYNTNNRITQLISFPILLPFSHMTIIRHYSYQLSSSCPLIFTTVVMPLILCFCHDHHHTSQYNDNANNRTTPLLAFPIILLFSCMTIIPPSSHWLLSSCPLIFATVIMPLKLCSQPICHQSILPLSYFLYLACHISSLYCHSPIFPS